jgi:CHAD domain-containing protein
MPRFTRAGLACRMQNQRDHGAEGRVSGSVTVAAEGEHMTGQPAESRATPLADVWKRAVRRVDRLRDAPTPRRVHKTRVALRRLRTALDGSDIKPVRGLRKELKRAFKALAPVRDADVLLAHLEDIDDDHAALAPLTRRLRKTRKRDWKTARKQLKHLDKRLSRKRTRKLVAALGDTGEAADPAELPGLLEAMLAFDPEIRSTTDGERFHQARIAVKHMRYSIEHAVTTSDAREAVLETLTGLQGAFGELHDQDVLLESLALEVERQDRKRTPDRERVAALRRILGNARRRRSTLRKRAVEAWSAAIDDGLGERIEALAG